MNDSFGLTAYEIKALDLFAGTGWGVACKRLGIKEAGVEIMPEAVETRTANGMETIYRDVWDGLQLTAEMHREMYGLYGLLIASPPCQTFSLAGKGAGRAALDEVLEAIDVHAYKDADALLRFGEQHDMRTALVLTPLAYVWRDRPRLVALEQVPTVLPVWEACAEVMREWGYEVKVEILNAEQYGVPQTRKRAILVARRGGPVKLPTPTHSRYYSRTPDKLDPGVRKWVSMAEALGWGGEDQTLCHGVQKNSARRPLTEPAATIAFGHDSASVGFASTDVGDHLGLRAAKRNGGFEPVTVEQAAALQSYPSMLRSNYGSGGDPANRGERAAGQPAPTLTSKADRNKWDGERNMTTDEAAALQSYPTEGWGFTNRPALTVHGHGLLTRSPTGQKQAVVTAAEQGEFTFRPPFTAENSEQHDYQPRADGYISMSEKYHADAVNCTTEENAILQSYEPPFIWRGSKTKQFLQIGNAVPPLLAEHILAALIGVAA